MARFVRRGPCRWQCPSTLMKTWREQTTKTRRRNPAGAEGAALLIRPKLKNLKIFAKNVHFNVQFFLCTPIGKKSCFFIGFWMFFGGDVTFFGDIFLPGTATTLRKMLIFYWFLNVFWRTGLKSAIKPTQQEDALKTSFWPNLKCHIFAFYLIGVHKINWTHRCGPVCASGPL